MAHTCQKKMSGLSMVRFASRSDVSHGGSASPSLSLSHHRTILRSSASGTGLRLPAAVSFFGRLSKMWAASFSLIHEEDAGLESKSHRANSTRKSTRWPIGLSAADGLILHDSR